MEIKQSTPEDLEEIFEFYQMAAALQKSKNVSQWQGFDRQLVEKEIREQRQWRLTKDDKTACIWAVTFEDAEIWEEKNKDAAVYIHRIVTHPDFRGQKLVTRIIDWAKGFAQAREKHYLRMDTVGANKGLIAHYTHCGFEFLGLKTLKNYEGLPKHYQNAAVSLFQIKLPPTEVS